MSTDLFEHEPMTAMDSERDALRRIAALLQEQPSASARLVSESGESIELPDTLYQLLRQAAQHLARDEGVSVVPVANELTTRQAAELLNVSRPYLIQLLERGDMPYHRVGTHRRIQLGDLLAYKLRRDRERRAGLRKISRLSQKMGLYDTRKPS